MDLEITKLDLRGDDRGIVVEILKKSRIDPEIKEILLISSKPGVVRGNHYHKTKAEWLCIIRGRAKFVYEDNETGERKEIIVSGEKPSLIRTPVNVAHAVKNIGDDELYMIEISNQIYDEIQDTFKKQIM
ncbi:MAG: WxcM-like domain-containing protein [Candidatus Micrarchaeota archaeon]|nr:WxcM-like domain-containing protein [Candidatus Micrarchaeota archaeon]